MSLPAPFERREVAPNWRWRDAGGNLHRPKEMVTRHLFNTLRMIWNNHVQEHMRVGAVRLYRFGPEYPHAYMRQAIVAIGRELGQRGDITPDQMNQLREMANWYDEFEPIPLVEERKP